MSQRGEPGYWEYLALWRPDGSMDLAATQANFPVTDYDAAELIRAEFPDGLLYAQPSGTWYVWDQTCLRPDSGGRAAQVVHDFGARMRWMLGEARHQLSDAEWETWSAQVRYAGGLLRSAGATSLLKYLADRCAAEDEFLTESDPHLINLANGTLDTRTWTLRPFRRDDRLTYCLDIPWNRQAGCPSFWTMLLRMTGDNREVALYLVKLLGYSLLGDNREQKIVFIAGPTGSGKSKLLHIVAEVLGPLAHVSQTDLICVVRHGRNARTENSIRGARFACITETSRYLNIDEAQLKRLTGEPVISVDQHYAKREIRTRVTFTIFVATNNMPTLTNYDQAMRRRIIVVPGGPEIEAWLINPVLDKEILEAEREGILNLLLWGLHQYQQTGLAMPDEVRWMTEQYAAEQNTVASFIADTMQQGYDGYRGTGIPQHQAWEMYEQWSRGGARLGRNEFMAELGQQPGMTWNKSMRRFEGYIWNAEWSVKVR